MGWVLYPPISALHQACCSQDYSLLMLAFQHIKAGCSWGSPSPVMSGAAIVTAGCIVFVSCTYDMCISVYKQDYQGHRHVHQDLSAVCPIFVDGQVHDLSQSARFWHTKDVAFSGCHCKQNQRLFGALLLTLKSSSSASLAASSNWLRISANSAAIPLCFEACSSCSAPLLLLVWCQSCCLVNCKHTKAEDCLKFVGDSLQICLNLFVLSGMIVEAALVPQESALYG